MIRRLVPEDRRTYVAMAKEFYATDAVLFHAGEEHFEATFDEMMRLDDYVEGYMLCRDGYNVGYALLKKTFSQEAGGKELWLDELYVRPGWRGKGLGGEFFAFLRKSLTGDIKRVRLEVEPENERAVALYRRKGFAVMPYTQMVLWTKRRDA